MLYNTLKAIPPRVNYTELYQKNKAALEAEFQGFLDEWQQTAVMVVNNAKKIWRQG